MKTTPPPLKVTPEEYSKMTEDYKYMHFVSLNFCLPSNTLGESVEDIEKLKEEAMTYVAGLAAAKCYSNLEFNGTELVKDLMD